MQESSLLVRGFEPANRVDLARLNKTQSRHKAVLQSHVPAAAEKTLNTAETAMFVLDDVVIVISALSQMIADAERSMLEMAQAQVVEMRAAKNRGSPSTKPTKFGRQELNEIIEAYMVYWLLGDHGHDQAKLVLEERNLLVQALPHWMAIEGYVLGMIQSWIYGKQHTAPDIQNGATKFGRAYELSSQDTLFTLDDAQEIVSEVTNSFASFWETECQAIKGSLLELDKTNNGRVRLVDFYGSNLDGEWRFGESEAYLRELGALDDTSYTRGPQVIIPNYLQGTSNCIASTAHYHVCCVNECEVILDEIEKTVGAPVATVEQLLNIVSRQTGYEDEPVDFKGPMTKQLGRIAELNGGAVPLHGRLFAQWLHYMFPHECPFPHKSGTVHALTPGEFGDDYIASKEEVERHTEVAAAEPNRRASQERLELEAAKEDEETLGMSQWTEDEELVGDYSQELLAPWDAYRKRSRLFFGGGAAILIALGGILAASIMKTESRSSRPGLDGFMMGNSKTHFV